MTIISKFFLGFSVAGVCVCVCVRVYVCVCVWCFRMSYILEINPLTDIWLANIFSHSIAFSFCWLFPLLCKSFLVWCSPTCPCLLLLPVLLVLYPKTYCQLPCQESFLLCFLPEILHGVLCFKSLIHFELTFVSDVHTKNEGSHFLSPFLSFFFPFLPSFFPSFLPFFASGYSVFPTLFVEETTHCVCSWHLCQWLVTFVFVGLFLGSLVHSIGPYHLSLC